MSQMITAHDLLLAHVLVSNRLGRRAEVNDVRVLHDVVQQLRGNLAWLSQTEKAAYLGVQLVKKRPFAHSNNATAVALTMAFMGSSEDLEVGKVMNAIISSSVIDEVAIQLESVRE
jgi:hypothetical protein